MCSSMIWIVINLNNLKKGKLKQSKRNPAHHVNEHGKKYNSPIASLAAVSSCLIFYLMS